MTQPRGQLSEQQVQQLLQPIANVRVLEAQGQSHVSQQDITAHLSRMFGFGNFDTEIVSLNLIYDGQREGKNGWDACYLATMRLTIRNQDGIEVAHYENGSTGDASNQKTRAAAHDLAMKSAISLATKRCAINLGDQFGLSLYNKGQRAALVRKVLVGGAGAAPTTDIQDGVPQQEALGTDETHYSNSNDAEVGISPEQQAELEKQLGAKPVQA